MVYTWLRLAMAAAFLVPSALGRWKQPGLPLVSLDAEAPDISVGWENMTSAQAREILEPLAPVVANLEQCTGSFKTLVDSIAMSLMLGMQVLLPAHMLDTQHLSRELDGLYRDYWSDCNGTSREESGSLRSFWCEGAPRSSLVSSASAVEEAFLAAQGVRPEIQMKHARPKVIKDRDDLLALQGSLPSGDGSARNLMKVDCARLSLHVNESDPVLWPLWWRVSDALDFADPIKTAADRFIAAIETHGEPAQERAKARGFPPFGKPTPHGRSFNMLHLRTDEAWLQKCSTWMGTVDGVHRDNCMNNTQSIAVVLVTEGVDPRLPLYIDTPLTTDELIQTGRAEIPGQYGRGIAGLTEAFTVITKGTILQDLQLQSDAFSPEQWGALDLIIASAANDYVGNSVAVESAFIMTARRHRNKTAWHYNGGSTPMQETGALKPLEPLSVPTFREPLKWIFAIHVGNGALSKSFVDQVKVAVLSARKHTSLIPVCITTADPTSEISIWLVSHGVRVVHHVPTWASKLRQKVTDLQNSSIYDELKARSHLYTDADAMIGTFMRIDIPVLGFLDEFVFYTDVDVIFKSDITWEVLLNGTDLDAIQRENDFARGRQSFAKPGPKGLPLYYSASSEIEMSEDPAMMNAGIMLMNLRTQRATYESFIDFIFNDPDLQWDEGPGDQGAIKSFFADSVGHPHGNFLPWTLNWKPYWAPNPEAKLIHFHGPKCASDVEPYVRTKEVHTEVFGFLLEGCTRDGDCVALCREFEEYLTQESFVSFISRH